MTFHKRASFRFLRPIWPRDREVIRPREPTSESSLWLYERPPSRKLAIFALVLRPIVQSGWIEVGSVGPYQRMGFGIDSNLVEHFQNAQGAV